MSEEFFDLKSLFQLSYFYSYQKVNSCFKQAGKCSYTFSSISLQVVVSSLRNSFVIMLFQDIQNIISGGMFILRQAMLSVYLLPNPAKIGRLELGNISFRLASILVLRMSGVLSITSLWKDLTQPSGLIKIGPSGNLILSAQANTVTLLNSLQKLSRLFVLPNGPRCQVYDFVVSFVYLCVELGHPFVDVVRQDLSQYIRFCDCAVDVGDDNFLVMVPQEYFQKNLLRGPIAGVENEFGPVLAILQVHLRYSFRVRGLAVLDNHLLLLILSVQGVGRRVHDLRRLYFIDVQLRHVRTGKIREPFAFCEFILNHVVYKWPRQILPKSILANKYSNAQLPSVEAVVNTDYQVIVVDESRWVLDELSVLDPMLVKCLQNLLFGLFFLLFEKISAKGQLKQGLLRILLSFVHLLLYFGQVIIRFLLLILLDFGAR